MLLSCGQKSRKSVQRKICHASGKTLWTLKDFRHITWGSLFGQTELMKSAKASRKGHLRTMGVAYLVLALSLVPTAVVYYRVRANVETHAQARFERAAGAKQAALEQRVPGCVEELLGVRGLFAANTSVNLDQWLKYGANVQIQKLYPGIRVLGYLERVDSDRKQAFVKRAAVESGAEVRILPEGDRPVYFPLMYASNYDPGLRGDIGRDDFDNPEYRPFMEMARDSGEPTATGNLVFTGQDSSRTA